MFPQHYGPKLKKFSQRIFLATFQPSVFVFVLYLNPDPGEVNLGPMGVLKYFFDRDACPRTNF